MRANVPVVGSAGELTASEFDALVENFGAFIEQYEHEKKMSIVVLEEMAAQWFKKFSM